MRRSLILFVFLCAAYLITYSGNATMNDEIEMFDITSSIVDFGDRQYDVFNWYAWTRYSSTGLSDPQALYPTSKSPIEPVLILSGIPFYWMAENTSGIGLLHAVLMVNIIISAAVGVLMYRYVLLLGYEDRVALGAALVLGFLTILWAYSRTYFREPLALFLTLLTAYWLEHLRKNPRAMWFGGAATLTFALAYYTKESSLMALPGLLLVMLPNQWLKHWTDYLLAIALLVTVIAASTNVFAENLPQIQFGVYKTGGEFFRIALHGYLISPTASIWGTSPIVLLAIPGAWLLIRQNNRRYIWVMLGILLGFAWGHALSADRHWIAGATLPPRFIIPALPFIVIVSIPALKWLLEHKRWLIAIGVVSLYIQFVNASLTWQEYPDHLPEASLGIVNWQPALNQWWYARPIVLTPVLFEKQLDYAWLRVDAYIWLVMFGGLAAVSLWLLWQDDRRRWIWGLPVALIILSVMGLRLIYDDPLYFGDNIALDAAASELDQQEQSGDVLLLNDPLYDPYFLNYRPFDEVRVISLQTPLGERGSFEQIPQVVSDNLLDLIDPVTIRLINALAGQRERLWLLMETGPFLPWAIRPVERYLTEYYYPLAEYAFDPTVRLLEFSTVPAPGDVEVSLELTYGDELTLTGFTLPVGEVYSAGEILPISLYWQGGTSRDYTVALFLADANGAIVSQGRDSYFVGGFVSRIEGGQTIQDNRAMRIPAELPAGDYQIWVRVYWFENGEIQILPVGNNGDIGILPVTIQIR